MKFVFLCVGTWFTFVRITFLPFFEHFLSRMFLIRDSISWTQLLFFLSKKTRIFEKILQIWTKFIAINHQIYNRKQCFWWTVCKIFLSFNFMFFEKYTESRFKICFWESFMHLFFAWFCVKSADFFTFLIGNLDQPTLKARLNEFKFRKRQFFRFLEFWKVQLSRFLL